MAPSRGLMWISRLAPRYPLARPLLGRDAKLRRGRSAGDDRRPTPPDFAAPRPLAFRRRIGGHGRTRSVKDLMPDVHATGRSGYVAASVALVAPRARAATFLPGGAAFALAPLASRRTGALVERNAEHLLVGPRRRERHHRGVEPVAVGAAEDPVGRILDRAHQPGALDQPQPQRRVRQVVPLLGQRADAVVPGGGTTPGAPQLGNTDHMPWPRLRRSPSSRRACARTGSWARTKRPGSNRSCIAHHPDNEGTAGERSYEVPCIGPSPLTTRCGPTLGAASREGQRDAGPGRVGRCGARASDPSRARPFPVPRASREVLARCCGNRSRTPAGAGA